MGGTLYAPGNKKAAQGLHLTGPALFVLHKLRPPTPLPLPSGAGVIQFTSFSEPLPRHSAQTLLLLFPGPEPSFLLWSSVQIFFFKLFEVELLYNII